MFGDVMMMGLFQSVLGGSLFDEICSRGVIEQRNEK
jgi:hypothetical protein